MRYAISFAAVILAGAFVYVQTAQSPQTPDPAEAPIQVVAPAQAQEIAPVQVPANPAQIQLSFAPVVRHAAPAVVNIYTKTIIEGRASPFAGDPFFDQFFGNGMGGSKSRVQNALGSGVILRSDGIIASNFHVVGHADEIRVVLRDGRQFDASVLLADEQTDIAIIKLDGASDLPTLDLRQSDTVEVGDLVLAIGNPFGVGQTVSSGIVSGVARTGMIAGNPRGYYVQTDAAINPGNSGGALVDVSGNLIGINTAILSRSGGSNGIGFAIPADLVAQVMKQALAGEQRFVKPWAGMVGQAVDADLAEALGLDRPLGLVISTLHPDSPFRAAGMVEGDVVTAINGHPVNAPAGLLYRMMVVGPNGPAQVSYLHDGQQQAADVAMIAPPETPARDERLIAGNTPLDGLHVVNVNPGVIAEMGLPVSASGVVVTDAENYAARLGFRPGDFVLDINGVDIFDTSTLEREAAQKTRRWRITLMRDGQKMLLQFRV